MEKPNWCNYSDAAILVWGCWSLLDGKIKKETDCLNCEHHIKQ